MTTLSIIIPILDDWKSLSLLLPLLDRGLPGKGLEYEVIVVDDGSREAFSNSELSSLQNIRGVTVVELKRNLGHQRAITIGLAYAAAERDPDLVLVMDGDGEDDPAEALKVINECRISGSEQVVFGKRSARSEGIIFRVFYALYRLVYKILTGHSIRVGNFSVIPRSVLRRLVVVSEVWNHYAAGVLKARVPVTEVDTHRGRRLSGRSRMNFVSLVTHGLSAISVYGDIAGVRLLLGTAVLILLSLIGILIVVIVRFATDLAIPGWATYVVAMLLIILMQAVTLSLFFIFLVLNNRDTAGFIPERDYVHYISRVREVFKRP